MPDDHPLSVGAARSLALQQADVVFLMGARLNWIFHFGLPPRFDKDVKVIQLDISPEAIGQNKPTEVALVGDGKAIVGAAQQGAGQPPVVPSEGYAVAQGARQEVGRERGDDQAADRRRLGAGQLLPRVARRRRLDAEERDPQRRGRQHDGYRPHPAAELRRPLVPQRRHLRHDGRRPRPGDRRRVAHPGPAGRPPLGRLGDRLLRHGDGDAGPLQLAGQDRRAEQRRHRPRHAGDPGKPDVQPEAQRADLRRALRQGDGGVRRQGLLRRGPEGHPQSALDEAMAFNGPALVNVVLSQGSTRKAQQFAWHS